MRAPGKAKMRAGVIRTDPSDAFNTALGGGSCCSAMTAFRQPRNSSEKSFQIKGLSDSHAILTWLDAVSMVRAAFSGDGAQFPLHARRIGSPRHVGWHGRQRKGKSR